MAAHAHRRAVGRDVADEPLPAPSCDAIEILHWPIRSYQQLERKIRQGTEALERNSRIDPGVGHSWRSLYRNHLQQGTLPAYYDDLRPNDAAITAQLSTGELLEDRRLQKSLGGQIPRVAVITPYYKESLTLLEQCHQSVQAQSEPCLHVLVADGQRRRRINHWQAEHVRLPRSHGDMDPRCLRHLFPLRGQVATAPLALTPIHITW